MKERSLFHQLLVRSFERWPAKASLRAIAILFFTGFCNPFALGRPSAAASRGTAARVLQIAQRLPGSTIDEATSSTQKIQALVLEDVDAWAKTRPVTFVQVRERLEHDLSKLRYPLYGRASSMEATWGHQALIVAGYSFGWSEYDRVNVVAIYGAGKTGTRRLATASFAPRTNLRFLPVESGPWRDFRFVVYGTRPGMSEPRLTAEVYAFDGKELKALWRRKDAFAGKIEVAGKFLTLRYVNVNQYVNDTQNGGLPPGHEAIYEFTPTGMQLVTIRSVSFP